MTIEAVFLDRDGVLNPHIPGGYLTSADDLVILPGAARAVRRLNDAGLPVIVISNQQGIGKGVMTIDDLQAIEARMGEMLALEAGAHLDRSYYCMDRKEANSPRRKPEPGMLLEAAQEFHLTLTNTILLGDSPTDIQAGYAAGVGATALLLSGGTQAEQAAAIQPPPHYIFADLSEAADWILEGRL
jgi:D-glycero-D-manno-heptose 1,7-bisphosphate phosphatase